MNAFMEATDYRVWLNYQMKSKLPCDRGHDEWIFTQTSAKWHTIGVLIFKKILKIANQNPYIEGETTQWPKEKGQQNKQWSTKYYA